MTEKNYQDGVRKVYEEIQKGERNFGKLILDNVPKCEGKSKISVAYALMELHENRYRRN